MCKPLIQEIEFCSFVINNRWTYKIDKFVTTKSHLFDYLIGL